MTNLVCNEIPESAICASDPIPKHLAATHRSVPHDQTPLKALTMMEQLTKGMLAVVVDRALVSKRGVGRGGLLELFLCGLAKSEAEILAS